MTKSDNFGNPNIAETVRSVLTVRSEPGGSTQHQDPASLAETISKELDRLRCEDVADHRVSLERKYDRLRIAYTHGLTLRDDKDVRARFYTGDHWSEYGGHKPNVARHGREHAMRFAIMRSCDGSEEGRKEASMFAAACWLLAHYHVGADQFLEQLRTMKSSNGATGPRALADEARRKMRRMREGVEELVSDEPAPNKGGHVRVSVPPQMTIERRLPLFLVLRNDEIVLSASPEVFVPVRAA